MGEARQRNGFGGTATMIDLSVSDRAIRRAKREYVSALSDKLLTVMAQDTQSDPARLAARAWLLAELHYEEMMRRQALPEDHQISMTERMAADRIVSEQKGG